MFYKESVTSRKYLTLIREKKCKIQHLNSKLIGFFLKTGIYRTGSNLKFALKVLLNIKNFNPALTEKNLFRILGCILQSSTQPCLPKYNSPLVQKKKKRKS